MLRVTCCKIIYMKFKNSLKEGLGNSKNYFSLYLKTVNYKIKINKFFHVFYRFKIVNVYLKYYF